MAGNAPWRPDEGSRETMRRNIRPCVTVYKNRSRKSLKPNLWDTSLLEEAGLRQHPIKASDAPQFTGGPDKHSTSTMAIAHEVFSSGQVVEPVATIARSACLTGRILPCLLQSDTQIAPLKEHSEKVSRPRAKKKPSKIEGDNVKPARVRDEAIIAKPAVEPVERAAGHANLENHSSTRRSSRIQDRWVRKTELRPGERWKRRLCGAAR